MCFDTNCAILAWSKHQLSIRSYRMIINLCTLRWRYTLSFFSKFRSVRSWAVGHCSRFRNWQGNTAHYNSLVPFFYPGPWWDIQTGSVVELESDKQLWSDSNILTMKGFNGLTHRGTEVVGLVKKRLFSNYRHDLINALQVQPYASRPSRDLPHL